MLPVFYTCAAVETSGAEIILYEIVSNRPYHHHYYHHIHIVYNMYNQHLRGFGHNPDNFCDQFLRTNLLLCDLLIV